MLPFSQTATNSCSDNRSMRRVNVRSSVGMVRADIAVDDAMPVLSCSAAVGAIVKRDGRRSSLRWHDHHVQAKKAGNLPAFFLHDSVANTFMLPDERHSGRSNVDAAQGRAIFSCLPRSRPFGRPSACPARRRQRCCSQPAGPKQQKQGRPALHISSCATFFKNERNGQARARMSQSPRPGPAPPVAATANA